MKETKLSNQFNVSDPYELGVGEGRVMDGLFHGLLVLAIINMIENDY